MPILDQGTEGACTGFGLATVVHYLLRTRHVIRDDLESARACFTRWHGATTNGRREIQRVERTWRDEGLAQARGLLARRLGLRPQARETGQQALRAALRRCVAPSARCLFPRQSQGPHRDACGDHRGRGSSTPRRRSTKAGRTLERTASSTGRPTPRSSAGTPSPSSPTISAASGFRTHGPTTGGRTDSPRSPTTTGSPTAATSGSARLGAPVILRDKESVSRSVGVAAQGSRSYVFCDLRPHIISLGNNGALKPDGTYGTSAEDVKEIFSHLSDRIDANESVPIKHLLLYAHGGLTAEDSAIQKVADCGPRCSRPASFRSRSSGERISGPRSATSSGRRHPPAGRISR